MTASPNSIRIWIGAAVAAASIAVQQLSGFFLQELIADAAILSLFALSVDLLARSGLVSFGHAGFLGLGAYAFGGLTMLAGLPPWLALVAAMAGGVLAGLVVGVFAIRTSGAFFIMVTLAAAEMFYAWVFRSKLFNGADGMGGLPRLELSAVGANMDDPATFALVCILFCIVVWLLLELVFASPYGRTLDAIRQNSSRVSALGGRVYSYRLTAFMASGAIAALAGVFKAQHTNFISPDLATWFVSGDVLIAVIIGGIGTLVGGILGTIVLVALREILSSTFGHWYLFLGALFAAVALFMPAGLVGSLMQFIERR
ncbi:MAG: branched-chain amino acid ABC transporter permease, partial [Beijerinckiaceae bacterium]